ncbi:MAG: hypothetical protein ABIF17_00045 [Patescibacteria group bacterium]
MKKFNKKEKNIVIIVGIVSFLFLISFTFINYYGTKGMEMLSLANLDEYYQYIKVAEMISSDGSMLNYDYFYYGYPFFLISALAILPIKIFQYITHIDFNNIAANIFILRQLGTILTLSAFLILIYMWTKFKYLWLSILLLIFLTISAPIITLNSWWHPDNLSFLFIILTIFFLYQDSLKFKKYFYLAAISCGLATGTKLLGVFFVLTIPMYLIYGIIKKKITFKKAIFLGIVFITIKFITIFLSNPLLLTRDGFNKYYSIHVNQAKNLDQGWITKGSKSTWLIVLKSFGSYFSYIIALGAVIYGTIQKKDFKFKLLSLLTISWILPYALYLYFIVDMIRWMYALPIIIPLLASLGFVFNNLFKKKNNSKRKIDYLIAIILIAIFIFQIPIIKNGINRYVDRLYWEERNPGIQFFNKFNNKVLFKDNRELVIFHNWGMYLPKLSNIKIEQKNGPFNYIDLEEIQPDYFLLEKRIVNTYYNENSSKQLISPDNQNMIFYKDVVNNEVSGYQNIMEDEYGMAFSKNPN